MTGSVVEFPRRPAPADDADPVIVIITGMSGAGRTQAAKVLEDLDYFVIDNLPPSLFGKVVELAFGPGSSVQKFAVVADVRGREFFGDLVKAIHELRDSEATVRVVFLEADDDTLVRRFEATRRRHPAEEGGGVLQGIKREREMLTELRGLADLIVDTSSMNVHELRDRVVGALGTKDEAAMHVKVVSFGFKYGTPRDADLVIDVRFLPNPHWEEDLRPFSGKDAPVQDFLSSQEATEPFLRAFLDLLDVTVPGYVNEGKRYLTIAIGCTGGKHRSVYVAERVAEHLQATTDLPVNVSHRHLGEE